VPGAKVHGSRELAEWLDGLNEEPGTERAAAWQQLWDSLGGGGGDGRQDGGGGGDGKAAEIGGEEGGGSGGAFDVVSLSHFLPYQELLPEKRFLTFPPLVRLGTFPSCLRCLLHIAVEHFPHQPTN
jgi:hypothetical protein